MALVAADTVTMQVVCVPLQAPLQPVKLAPVATDAVSVTMVPMPKFSEQSLPQLMPAGDDVTVPKAAPLPARVTVSASSSVKVAVTVLAAFMVTTQPPGAKVVVDGEVVGLTPMNLSYDARQERRLELVLKKDNYQDLPVMLSIGPVSSVFGGSVVLTKSSRRLRSVFGKSSRSCATAAWLTVSWLVSVR